MSRSSQLVLQDISGEHLNRGSNKAQDARLDIPTRGFRERHQPAFFDVRVCHPNAVSYRNLEPLQIRIHENEKKRLYSMRKRLDGSVDFDRVWKDYKQGFGNLNGEFWLGLDKVHRLTKEQSKLRVELEDFNGQTAYAEYDLFGVADEGNKYRLTLGTYAG
ncbi:unnamed protein product [Porites evermanni]|uniref:Fibrinogen C-terminal domain-containing protein n=1 Tax=Porites evermanni TaxID=104178 RepID=A0ABN8Q0W1_9CNID|nr:unnamed protein product [Porites evermanni]